MIVSYEGVEFIKITHGNTTVACNPISKESKHKGPSFGADIALISLDHPDTNGADNVSRKDKEPLVISGPGEYEIEGLFIKGFQTTSEYGGKEQINTIYKFEIDGIRVAYLGALSQTDLPGEVKEELGDTDILIVPIGGNGVLEASEAYSVAVKREPSIIIPMHYGIDGDKTALKDFLKEGGAEDVKAIDKLTIKKKDLLDKKGEIVVLKNS